MGARTKSCEGSQGTALHSLVFGAPPDGLQELAVEAEGDEDAGVFLRVVQLSEQLGHSTWTSVIDCEVGDSRHSLEHYLSGCGQSKQTQPRWRGGRSVGSLTFQS